MDEEMITELKWKPSLWWRLRLRSLRIKVFGKTASEREIDRMLKSIDDSMRATIVGGEMIER